MEGQGHVSDRFSDLPLDVVHHILPFLETKDIIVTGTLSKTILSVAKSFLVLDFDYYYVWRIMTTDEFLNYVLERCFQYDRTTVLEKFRLYLPIPSFPDDRLDRAVSFAEERKTKYLDLSIVCKGCRPPPLPPAIVFAKSVTRLCLDGFKLEHFNDMIQSCPLLEELNLNSCELEDDFSFSSSTIKSINLQHCEGIKQFRIESPSLERFGFGYLSSMKDSLNESIFKIPNLKLLSVEYAPVTERWIQQLVPQLVVLETIELFCCNKLKKFNVSNENLKSVRLMYCEKLDVIEIGAINLESFKYEGPIMRKEFSDNVLININQCKHLKNLELHGKGIPSELLQEQLSTFLELDVLKLSLGCFFGSFEINLENLRSLDIFNPRSVNININTPRLECFYYSGNHLNPFGSVNYPVTLDTSLSIEPHCDWDTSNYGKWLEFLQLWGSCKVLMLSCPHKEMLICPQELRETVSAPLVNVRNMEIELRKSATVSIELVDSLLWLSPYLETLDFTSYDSGQILLSIKFEYESRSHTLVEIENFAAVDEKDNLLKYFKGKAKSVNWN